jgi:hypothetical protein
MKPNQKEAKFEQYRTALHDEIMRLATYARLFRRLHERRKDRLQEMNLAPAFFTTTIDSLWVAIVLWVDKLFDNRSQRGLINFLKFIEQNRPLFDLRELQRRKNYPDGHWMPENRAPVTLKRIHADIAKVVAFQPQENFKRRRDKFHAHFDKKYFFEREKLEQEAPIKWGELHGVIELGKSIVNAYSADYDGELFRFEPLNATDVDHLLDRLHFDRQRNQRDKH